MTVDIFIPCFIDQFFPETGFNMIRILEKLGHKVHYNPGQTCCGQIAFNTGYWEEAKAVGAKFIRDFPNSRPVVSPTASCTAYVKNYFHELFHNTSLHNEYKQLQKNIFEFTDFVVNRLGVTDLGAHFPHRVTYHDSCAALREYGLGNEPRLLLAAVKGLELVEMEENDFCCGFGGTFSVKNEAISTAMADRKIENALKTGAEFIVSTDASCLMHLQGYISKNNIPLKTIHIVDVLACGW
jgi:L-lactate dehydrogenase complex protein LldE